MTAFKKNIFILCALFFLSISLNLQAQQTTTGNLEDAEDPMEKAFRSHFENINVGNLHVYLPETNFSGDDSYFKGVKLDRGLYGLYDDSWRRAFPDEFDSYAVYNLKSNDPPVYILRFAGVDVANEISLFTMDDGKLQRIGILAKSWCDGEQCYQRESWIQDFNGDTELDVLTKVRWLSKDGEVWKSKKEFHLLYIQNAQGDFVATDDVEINVDDYRLSDFDQRVGSR